MMIRPKDQRPPREHRPTSNLSRRHGGGRSSLLSPGARRAQAPGYLIRLSPRLIVTLQAGEGTSKRTSTQRHRFRRRWRLRVSWSPCNCARRWPKQPPASLRRSRPRLSIAERQPNTFSWRTSWRTPSPDAVVHVHGRHPALRQSSPPHQRPPSPQASPTWRAWYSIFMTMLQALNRPLRTGRH